MASLLLSKVKLPGTDQVRDVLIEGGRVTSVAPTGTIDANPVKRVDAAGRWLLPGLWDHHVHFGQWAQTSRRLDLSSATSAGHAARLVEGWIEAKAGRLDLPIVGYGFRDALWPEAPNLELIDAAAGERPTVLISGDLHSAWLNRAALVRYGHDGHPTGLLREEVAMTVMTEISQVSVDISDAWVAEAASAAAARGVVGIVDLERPYGLDDWQRRITQGQRTLRVRSGVWAEALDQAIEGGLFSSQPVAGTDGLLQVGPMKVITDGSLNTRTAYCHDPYPGLTADAHGLLLVPPTELTALLTRAATAGFRCAVHAIGDAANALALQAYADSGATGSIEHAQLLDIADVARFAELGVIASMQPEHAVDDRDVADHYWTGRTNRAFMLRRLLDAGAVLALGSDAPVAPLDPWIAIAAAVTRTRGDRPAWHPEQAITAREAIAASGADPGRDEGEIRPGMVADLVVCEADPYRSEPGRLRGMPVWATLIEGRFTHRTEG